MIVKKGIVGQKIGMMMMFEKEGRLIPVTVIEAGPCLVTQVKTEDKDGYNAVQLGFGRGKNINQPLLGQLKKIKKKDPLRVIREIRLEVKDEAYKVGQQIKVDIFKEGELVDITGTSIGKGFAGRIKRHHFNRGPMTHGSKCHRLPGSIGAGTSPGHVLKGLRMAGHLGNATVTARNLEVVKVDAGRNLLLVKGSVPGSKKGLLVLGWKGKIKKVIHLPKKEEAKKTERKGSEKK
jgi:large subunit ribosomal protein L3